MSHRERRKQLLSAELYGWLVCLWRRRGPCGFLFDLALTPPGRDLPAFEVRLWPSLERACESGARRLASALQMSPLYVGAALRDLLETETRP